MNDNYLIPLILFGTLLLIMLAFIITSLVIIHRQRAQQYRLKIQELEYHYENELLRTRIEVREKALDWVSKEIHDNVGQVLSITRMQLLYALDHGTGEGRTLLIRESADLINTCLKDLRNLSHLLSGELMEKAGLTAAIEKELYYIRSIYKLECGFNHPEELPPLTAKQNLLLFRITQEALNNVVRHAGASIAIVTIMIRKNSLRLKIQDNGKGMDPGNESKGLGLINMRQRAKLLKGALEIHSQSEKGTTLTVTIMCDEEQPLQEQKV